MQTNAGQDTLFTEDTARQPIEAGDPEMAEAAMRIHIGEFADHAERHYAHVMEAPLRWDQVDD